MSSAAAILVVGLAANGAAAPPAGVAAGGAAITVVDDVGRELRLERIPRRIVSTAPSNTAALFALGAGERVVGVTRWCDDPPEAAERPKIGDFSHLDLEAIVALEPDLVVTTWLEQRRQVERLQALGLPVLVLYPKSIDQTLASLVTLGRAVGAKAAAQELVAGLERRLAAMRDEVAKIPADEHPLVFVQLNATPLYTAGPGSTVAEAIRLAGGRNLAADLGKPYATISAEVVIARDPDVVLLGMGAAEAATPVDAAVEVASRAGFERLAAVRSHRVYRVDPRLLFHQNHRLVDAVEELYRLFHRRGHGPDPVGGEGGDGGGDSGGGGTGGDGGEPPRKAP